MLNCGLNKRWHFKDAVFDDLSIDDATIVSTLTGIPVAPIATFVRSHPSAWSNQLEIEPWSTIDVIFDNPPTYVKVYNKTNNEYVWFSMDRDSNIVTIDQPRLERWRQGTLELVVTWANGSHTLKYRVKDYTDTDPPIITYSTIQDGDTNVDPEDIYSDCFIEVRFSESVSGNITLQTEGSEDVGWIGKVDHLSGTLECLAGRKLEYDTTYVISGEIHDNAGNETIINITFRTLLDTDSPTIIESNIQDGATNVDAGFLNSRLIEIWFSEEVEGDIELQTEDGENLHWSSGVQGRRVWLQRVSGVNRGKDVQDGITYVIIGKVHDNAGNETIVSITFTTLE